MTTALEIVQIVRGHFARGDRAYHFTIDRASCCGADHHRRATCRVYAVGRSQRSGSNHRLAAGHKLHTGCLCRGRRDPRSDRGPGEAHSRNGRHDPRGLRRAASDRFDPRHHLRNDPQCHRTWRCGFHRAIEHVRVQRAVSTDDRSSESELRRGRRTSPPASLITRSLDSQSR